MKVGFKGTQLTDTFIGAVKADESKDVSSRWVFRWKSDQIDHVVKPKARVAVVQGARGNRFLRNPRPHSVDVFNKGVGCICLHV